MDSVSLPDHVEYLSGKSLNRVLRAPDFAGMPFAKALPIVTGMGRALSYAHERGFVHCDFKPANVFLTDSGEVKVIDFGIARVFQQPADDADPTVFDPGTLGGMTPAYASRDVRASRRPDPRDDIYALACVTYELLTGRHPYERLSANQARGAGLKPQRPKSLSRGQWRRAARRACPLDRATHAHRGTLPGRPGSRSAAARCRWPGWVLCHWPVCWWQAAWVYAGAPSPAGRPDSAPNPRPLPRPSHRNPPRPAPPASAPLRQGSRKAERWRARHAGCRAECCSARALFCFSRHRRRSMRCRCAAT
ncbi:serine/threonine-protein kinase [Cupriavidus basilensis]